MFIIYLSKRLCNNGHLFSINQEKKIFTWTKHRNHCPTKRDAFPTIHPFKIKKKNLKGIYHCATAKHYQPFRIETITLKRLTITGKEYGETFDNWDPQGFLKDQKQQINARIIHRNLKRRGEQWVSTCTRKRRTFLVGEH